MKKSDTRNYGKFHPRFAKGGAVDEMGKDPKDPEGNEMGKDPRDSEGLDEMGKD